MSDTRILGQQPLGVSAPMESPVSAVSWAAVIAGAAISAATMLALLALGSGIGLGSVSPWSNAGVSSTTFGILAAAWLIAIQLFAYGVGGYIAGRLRTQWVGVHTDEVFFRDTAHGFLVWAVGAILSASLIASAIGAAATGAAQVASAAVTAAGSVAGQASQAVAAPGAGETTSYFTDMLFRSDKPAADQSSSSAEAGRILARNLTSGTLSAEDKPYLAKMVAAKTGLAQADAEKRVDQVMAQAKAAATQAADEAKKAADVARKAGVYASLWVFVSLLVGAFSACYMATIGGRIRDDLPAVGDTRQRAV